VGDSGMVLRPSSSSPTPTSDVSRTMAAHSPRDRAECTDSMAQKAAQQGRQEIAMKLVMEGLKCARRF